MAEKVHQEKLQGIQTRLTYCESSHRNSQTRLKKKRPKKRRQSPVTASRGTRPSQTASVFSRLRHERDKPTHRRSPMRATVFTRLGPGDKNVFTQLGERKRGVHSRLGPEDAPRHRRVSRKRSTSRSAKTPSQRRKDVRELIRSYVTCPSKHQQEIEEEWNTADRASRRPYTRTKELYYSENDHDQGGHWKSKKRRSNDEDDLSQPWLCKETDPFTMRIWNFEVPKRTRMPVNVKTYDGIKDPEDHLKIFHTHRLCQGFIHGLTNPDLIKKLNDNISVDEMMSVTTAFLRGEVAAANQSKKKVLPAWKHNETSHKPNFDKRPDFKSQHKSSRQQDRFTPLTKTPKEILAMDIVKFKAPPPMTGPVENQNKNKFYKFHGDKGHNTDECIHIRRQIEEAVKSG
ncbi:hypothetical protein Tco_0663467 [Tanacetum coccineum]